MYNSKIVILFKSFTKKERNSLFSLISSGYYSLSQEETTLLHYLNDIIRENVAITKQQIFTYIYKHQKYNDQKLRLMFSNTFKILEQYCALIELKNAEPLNKELLQIKYYGKRNLQKLYYNKYKALKSQQSKAKAYTPYQLLVELQMEHYQFESLQKRDQDLHIQEMMNLSDQHYYYQKLLFSCLAISHESVYASAYDYKNLSIIVEDLKLNLETLDPILKVLYYCYHMMRYPEESSYHQNFKHLFLQHQNQYTRADQQSLYIFAINYCIKKLNSGETQYGIDGLDFYIAGIKSGMLFNNGKLSRYTYRNMAMMAIRTGDFERAEKLTVDYEHTLRAGEKKPAFHMNMALINFYKKDFDAAIDNIVEVDFKDHLINLAAKVLQAKIYFESNQDKLLDSLLDSIDMYLIRKKVIGYHKTNYKNIIRYFKKLNRINPYDKSQLEKLAEQIKKEKVLTERKWLLEQITRI